MPSYLTAGAGRNISADFRRMDQNKANGHCGSPGAIHLNRGDIPRGRETEKQ